MGLKWGTRRIAQPQTQGIQIVCRVSFEPRLDGVPELPHATEYRSIGGAPEADYPKRLHLCTPKAGRHRNLVQLRAGRCCETVRQLGGRRERNNNAEQRALVGAEHEMSWARGHDVGVPITKAT
jgi:hypothetical protein